MQLHRFIGDYDFSKKTLLVNDSELVNQLKNVLRLKSGSQVILVDNKLQEAVAEIKDFQKEAVEFEINAISKNEKEPATEVTLYCAIIKKENFELVVQKATEAGVSAIVPILTKRTVKLSLREDRLEKIAKEAAEQSGRGIIPTIHEVTDFKKALEQSKDYSANLFFKPGASLFNQERLRNSGAKRVSIFIGPEGGWDDSEIEMAQMRDLKIVGLGGLTLRAETAAIIASYLVANAASS